MKTNKIKEEEKLRRTLNVLMEHYGATTDEKLMFNKFVGLREQEVKKQATADFIKNEIKFLDIYEKFKVSDTLCIEHSKVKDFLIVMEKYYLNLKEKQNEN